MHPARGAADGEPAAGHVSDPKGRDSLVGRASTALCVHLYHHRCFPVARITRLPGVDTVYYDFLVPTTGSSPGARVGRVDLAGRLLRFDLDACDLERGDVCACAGDRSSVCERCWRLVQDSARVVTTTLKRLRLGRVYWFYSGNRGLHGLLFTPPSRTLSIPHRIKVCELIKREGGTIDAQVTTSLMHKIRAPWSCHEGGHVNWYLGVDEAGLNADTWTLERVRLVSNVRHVLAHLESLLDNLERFVTEYKAF